MNSPTDAGRLPWLDVLRGLAIALVIVSHVPVQDWMRCGWVGVDLFFVLSGFLIGGLLFAEYRRHGKIDILRFYLRRGLKIYPAFYVFLLVSLPIQYLFEPLRLGWTKVIAEVLFIQNYFSAVWGHTWSLAVEEHFYLALPLFLVLLAGRGTAQPFARLPRAVLVILCVVLLWRLRNVLVWPVQTIRWRHFPTHLRLDSLLFGVLLAYLYHYQRAALLAWRARYRGRLLTVALLMLFPLLGVIIEIPAARYTLLYLAFGAVLLCGLEYPLPAAWRWLWRPFAALGYYSYSIYLWHMPVGIWMEPLFPGDLHLSWWRLVLTGMVSVVAGVAMANIIEYPVLRLRDRWLPSRSRA